MLSTLRDLSRRLRFKRLHSPEVRLRSVVIGTDYGGWPVVPALLRPGCLVYSFGIGEDISFDLGIIARFDAQVHAFDPTPRSWAWLQQQTLPTGFAHHQIGLAARSGAIEFFEPADPGHVSFSNAPGSGQSDQPVLAEVATLGDIMAKLGHNDIDVLKMDIEGFEYEVIQQLASGTIRPRLLLVEFHHGMYQATEQDTLTAAHELGLAGYRIFHVSATGREYGFVHETALRD